MSTNSPQGPKGQLDIPTDELSDLDAGDDGGALGVTLENAHVKG